MTPAMAGTDRYGPACDMPVMRPVMLNRWESLTFLHWRYQPEVVQRLLPPGLTVDTFDGSAWVALVPFVLRWKLPRVPSCRGPASSQRRMCAPMYEAPTDRPAPTSSPGHVQARRPARRTIDLPAPVLLGPDER